MERPRSLYVHIPFCEKKCPYCAFNSHAGSSSDTVTHYLEALTAELRSLGTSLPLETIYVGGGTPTSLAPSELATVLASIRDLIAPGSDPEWTVEMNPGTVNEEKVDVIIGAGVNRASMGVQSLDPAQLKLLGRIHDADDVRRTVSTLQDRGFENINLDLIYGQPYQTAESFFQDVDGLLTLGPKHLSLYALQYEEGTPYTRARDAGRLEESAEDLVLSMFHGAHERLLSAGFELYEISNFALPGHRSRHNERYWRNLPYYGVGSGAYACVEGERRLNELDPVRYTDAMLTRGSAIVEREVLTPRATYVESLVAGLRTREGADLDAVLRRTGLDPRIRHRDHLEFLLDKGLAEVTESHLVLSLEGLWVLDAILEPFLDVLDPAS